MFRKNIFVPTRTPGNRFSNALKPTKLACLSSQVVAADGDESRRASQYRALAAAPVPDDDPAVKSDRPPSSSEIEYWLTHFADDKTLVFRTGLTPIDIHLTISALSFHYVANNGTFSMIFDLEMMSPAALAHRREEVVEVVLRSLRV